MKNVICKQCNSFNPPGSKFCNHCGASLPPSTSLICPNCGTGNPHDLLYCDTCGTRLLKEATAPIEQPEDTKTPGSRQVFSLPARRPGETGDLDPNRLPDWLKTGERERRPEEAKVDDEPAEGEEKAIVDDWLAELTNLDNADDSISEDAGYEDDEMEEVPAWLQATPIDDVAEATAPVPSSSVAEEDDQLFDWFSEPDQTEEDIYSSAEEVGASGEDFTLDGWLNGESFGEESEEGFLGAAEESEDEIPDWMLQSDSLLEDLEESEAIAGDVGALIDADQGVTADDLPDWLSGPPLDEETAASLFPLAAEDGSDDLTDWLSDTETRDSDEEKDKQVEALDTTEEEVAPGDDFPEWLAGIAPQGTGLLGPLDADTTAEDFLPGGDRAWDEEQPTLGESAELAAAEDIPDWLTELAPPGTGITSSGLETPDEESALEANASPVEDVPDWLEEVVSEEGEAISDEPTIVADWLQEDFFEDSPLEEESEIGAAITDEEETALTPPSEELEGVPEQLAGAELPDWLQDSLAVAPITPAIPISHEELPEWLQSVDEEEFDAALEAALSARSGDILTGPAGQWPEEGAGEDTGTAQMVAEADLPEWLRSLKPGVSVEEEAEPEPETLQRTGPLAGLRGVIDIEPAVAQPYEAEPLPAFAISKDQQQQIALLRQLARDDQKPVTTVFRPQARAMSLMARLVLGGALVLVLVLGQFLPALGYSLVGVAPPPVSTGARQAHAALEAAAGRPVLVAFDYTPALAAELDPQAAVLLRQLAAGGSPVITVSQFAAGVAMSQRSVAGVSNLNVQELGLLPGEAVGIRKLGLCFREGNQCQPVWGQPWSDELRGALQDVALIIILTGERESLVNWIEQAGTGARVPMVAGLTQALAPVAIPYQTSGQLSGSIEGLPAVAAYERELLGNAEGTDHYLISQTLAQWLVIALLIVGNLWYGMTGLVARFRRVNTTIHD